LCGGVWVLGEERDGVVHPVTHELLAWGRELADRLGDRLTCTILGAHAIRQAREIVFHGADRVIVVCDEKLRVFRVDPYARILLSLIREERPEILLAAATTMGRTLMPVLAARLRTGLTADCTQLDIDPHDRLLLQTRPAIGGHVMATIKTLSCRPQMATIRPKSRRPLPRTASRRGEVVVRVFERTVYESRVSRVSFRRDPDGNAPLQDAEIVVCGGRGLKTARGFAQLYELAQLLGGNVGASRPAVDQGWAPYACQVGLSGKSIRPRVYLALGISGAPNHLAGMSSAERVVAVNNDPNADILKVADLGIVADANEVIPMLVRRLRMDQAATFGRGDADG